MAGFLFGLLAVVIIVLLAVRFRPVRWLLAALGGLAALGALGIFLYLQHQEREREEAKHLVTVQQLQFDDMRLVGDKLVGRVRNLNQRYTVTGAELQVSLKDCVELKCDVVGQTTTTLYLEVPPGQVRGIDEYLFFNNVPELRGARQWGYRVTSVSAH